MAVRLRPVFRWFWDQRVDDRYTKTALGFVGRKALHSARPRALVRADATVTKLGGDMKDELSVLGEYVLQFGQFQGNTFRWLLDNALSYASAIVYDMGKWKEVESAAALSQNKFDLKRYLLSFPEGQESFFTKTKIRKEKGQIKSNVTCSQGKFPLMPCINIVVKMCRDLPILHTL